MVNYRRNLIAGGTYFFTLNLAERHRRLLTDHIDLLRAALRYTKAQHPFTIEAIVVLPDHLHTMISSPEGDSDYALRLRLMKTHFSRHIPKSERQSCSRIAKGERGIWQRRYWEHTVRDDEDYDRHVNYIHFNPMKHGHVSRVRDWPYSSFHRFVRLGIYVADWAGDSQEPDGSFGE